jgi:PAS domain S-box-containing protein
MLTTLPLLIVGAALSFITAPASTSCIATCLGTHGPLFHAVESLQVLISMVSLTGIPLAVVSANRANRAERIPRIEKLCRMLIETTNDGVWIVDCDNRTTFINRRMAEMLGYLPNEIQGRRLIDFMFPEDVSEQSPDFLRPCHFREVLKRRFRRKDGSELWARVSARLLVRKAGEPSCVMIIVSDTTLVREMEDTLRRNEKLVTAGRLTATVSHEINGSLEAVLNILHLLNQETLTEQGQQYLRLAEKEVQRISAIRKRTLELFRDSHSWEELSLSDLLDDTISFCHSKLVAHSISVLNDYRSRGIARVSRGGLQQVFANVICNAVEAMSTGGTLTLRVIDVIRNNTAGIQVEVEDTGSGIADANLKRIFDPFFTTKQNGGTGLGLWVAKEIVEKHGGTVTVTSRTQPGKKCGTRFSILLPCATAQAAA